MNTPIAPNTMLRALDEVSYALHALLVHHASWTGMLIDYADPVVERLYTDAFGYRVALHRIYPCEKAMYHPHPWPSAVWLVDGNYEMGVGYGAGEEPPPLAMQLVIPKGTRYEMVHPDGWHYVRPVGAPTLSLMVSGKPWGRPTTDLRIKHRALADGAREALFRDAWAAITRL